MIMVFPEAELYLTCRLFTQEISITRTKHLQQYTDPDLVSSQDMHTQTAGKYDNSQRTRADILLTQTWQQC